MSQPQIRDALPSDLPAIVAIYNASIPGRTATADLDPITVESRQEWFARHNPQSRPLWVLEVEQQVVAWIGLSSFYGGRSAYDATAEISIYLAPQYQGQGYGGQLVAKMLQQAPQLGVTTFLVFYFAHNEASRRLFDRFHFQPVGYLPDIANLDGVKRSLVIAALKVDSSDAAAPQP